MNRFKKILRILGLVFFITLASIGIGAIIPFNSREKYMNHEIRVEQVEKREEENEMQSDEDQNKG